MIKCGVKVFLFKRRMCGVVLSGVFAKWCGVSRSVLKFLASVVVWSTNLLFKSESIVIGRGKPPLTPPPPPPLPLPSLDRLLLDLPLDAESDVVAKGRRNWPGERPNPSRLLEPRTGIIVVVAGKERDCNG